MRAPLLPPIVAALLLTAAGPGQAQQFQPLPASAGIPLASSNAAPVAPLAPHLGPESPHRTRDALLGGAIGAAAGVVFCTVISTLADDSADGGLSFCPLDSYLLIGGAGFVVGAVIGWLL
ncbi:MAG TPA: hypothetical protein VLA95_02610 [Gemmatimonadales bacterium]|nr:hypothetical protein [Gemmatimonadales bacterium]